jgi:hypothetical protein
MSIRNVLWATAATASVLLLVGATGAIAQQSTGQQKCLNLLNRDGTAVAKQQGLEDVACLKAAGTGKLVGSAQSCLTADVKGRVLKKKAKTTSDEGKLCTPPPSFGHTSATAVNNGAVQGELDLSADVFGANLDPAVISCGASKTGCQCQQKVLGDVEKLADKKLAEFVKCKKTTLKNGASSVTSLRACVEDAGTPGSIAADSKGLIQKALGTLNTDIAKKCDAKGVTAGAFPGGCTGLTDGALGACLDVKVECRVCQIINDMDGLLVNCDLFDDGNANGSCASGSGPTPTPTPGPTPTPTPAVLKGALTATNGRFNYNLTLGLPGANAACNTSFPGTHACTYSELQSAAAAGDLDGLKDTANNMVTSFWAIDNAQPALQQCQDDATPGGSFLNWEYGTAHTASRGQKVSLNNATGVLGSLQSSLQCNLSGASWVGCCL